MIRRTLIVIGSLSCLGALFAVALPDLLPHALIALPAVFGCVLAWPSLRHLAIEGFAFLRDALAAGRGWCLRLVQDLRQPDARHLGLLPRYMTGYGPLLA